MSHHGGVVEVVRGGQNLDAFSETTEFPDRLT